MGWSSAGVECPVGKAGTKRGWPRGADIKATSSKAACTDCMHGQLQSLCCSHPVRIRPDGASRAWRARSTPSRLSWRPPRHGRTRHQQKAMHSPPSLPAPSVRAWPRPPWRCRSRSGQGKQREAGARRCGAWRKYYLICGCRCEREGASRRVLGEEGHRRTRERNRPRKRPLHGSSQ